MRASKAGGEGRSSPAQVSVWAAKKVIQTGLPSAGCQNPRGRASDPKEISRASMQKGDLEYDRNRIRRTNTWEVAHVGDFFLVEELT